MDELASVRRRARRASELGRVHAAMRIAPALGVLVVVLAVLAPPPSAWLIALVGAAAIGARWWRRSWGEGAREGVQMGAPVAIAAALARSCAPGEGWECGAICIALGVVSAVVTGLTRSDVQAAGTERIALALFAAATAFAGCAALGAGIALAAALATVAAWAGALAWRNVTT